MKIPMQIDEVTVMFNVTESEIEEVGKAIEARGLRKDAPRPEIFIEILTELDRRFPGHNICQLAETEAIGVAVHPVEKLPDSRLTRLPPLMGPGEVASGSAQALPQARAGTGIIAAKLAPAAMRGQLAGLEMVPLDEEIVAQYRKPSEARGMPYPTHQGVISLDGKGEIKVYQLSDGQRVVDAHDLHQFFTRFGGV
jgi:hypothetical protein